ncbi:S41 family peptidase [Spongiivirga sp. MCCC 1A20706]|uniref:S41 family peptidase n=1 Tax=Spongiivirga sp. MCCC 1A20706 TaxID=3160963 RepID=UPI003977B52C
MKNIFKLILLMLFAVSCEATFLGNDEGNTSENNFELLWHDFDEHYSLFNVRGFNWDSIYSVYRPRITESTSQNELWDVFVQMTSYLDDSHVFIFDPATENLVASGSENEAQIEAETSPELVRNSYIQNPKPIPNTPENEQFFYGVTLTENIGYLFLQGMDFDASRMDIVVHDLASTRGLIIDIRNNEGGSDRVAAEVAGRYTTERKLAYSVQEKNGPNHNDFANKKLFYTETLGTQNYTKPIVILTDQETVSAAEIFLIRMKTLDNVTQIGDVTAGDFSDVSTRRFLPNGWQYQYSIFKVLLPNGSSLDGIGHIPDIYVRNTIEDLENGHDKVLERAIAYLNE